MRIINRITLLSFLIFVWSCTTQTTSTIPNDNHYVVVNNQPYLGQSFHGQNCENAYIIDPRNQIIKRMDVIYNDIKYSLGVSKDQTIKYIVTSDKRFSVDGFRIGDKISGTNTILGWGNYTKINDEWYAAWMPHTRYKNKKKGKIQWFFRYVFPSQSQIHHRESFEKLEKIVIDSCR